MAAHKVWFKVKLGTLIGFIALLEIQGRYQEANGVRLVLKWSHYKINEAEVQRHKDELTSHSQ